MTIHHDPAESSAPWRAAAAYLYTLDLDDPALAWEYLRRHPGYRTDWITRQRGVSHSVPLSRWGLRCRGSPAPRCPPSAANVDGGH